MRQPLDYTPLVKGLTMLRNLLSALVIAVAAGAGVLIANLLTGPDTDIVTVRPGEIPPGVAVLEDGRVWVDKDRQQDRAAWCSERGNRGCGPRDTNGDGVVSDLEFGA
ncbi:hypothetical protein [Prauserella flavalba]|uniref:hypothetical protein n=1 Tax=Prauserella flavalba TaxID=1477506 RepID=UPI0036E5CEDB